MKLGDIQDCEQCPLYKEECPGGMVSSAAGIPIEPPCTSWDEDQDLDYYMDGFYSSKMVYEDYQENLYITEEIKKEKQKIKNKRARESRLYVYRETKEIRSLKKSYKNLCSIESLANAFSITNEMFNIDDKRPGEVKSITEIKKEEILQRIATLEHIKKQKLRDLRDSRKSNKEQ